MYIQNYAGTEERKIGNRSNNNNHGFSRIGDTYYIILI